MPKKHRRTFLSRPANTAHHTLASSGVHEHERYRPIACSSETSVNDLISHLRRTQVSSVEDRSSSSAQGLGLSRSVPPSLRTILDLPEAQTPRSRPNAPPRTVIGSRPRRPIPGPPPPESWLSEGSSDTTNSKDDPAFPSEDAQRVIYRLQRLPDVAFPHFPGDQTLQHAVLKTMALEFAWHLDYDGVFLCQLPWHTRVLLLSYVASYGHDEQLAKRMMGLKPLFITQKEYMEIIKDDPGMDIESYIDADATVTRLDLGSAMGRWLSFKQLTHDLFVSGAQDSATAQTRAENVIPDSWDDPDPVNEDSAQSAVSAIPQPMKDGPRFTNLRSLSLAHPNKDRVSWDPLLRLLSRLSTITHLSLAHWPAPFHGPPRNQSWGYTFSPESSAVLRQFCRHTYCLKWLDLEGCSDWLSALVGDDRNGSPTRHESAGPEWNGAWRDIEWVNLAPGWNLVDPEEWVERPLGLSMEIKTDISRPDVRSEPLVVPVYSMPSNLDTLSDSNWNAEDKEMLLRQHQAYLRYQRTAEIWVDQVHKAIRVYQEIRQIRASCKGKRIEALTGAEGLDMADISRSISTTGALVRENLRRAQNLE